MINVIVIYYDGNENKAAFVETETPDSSAPHVFGLADNCDVVAVITMEKGDGKIEHDVFIEETNVLSVAWG